MKKAGKILFFTMAMGAALKGVSYASTEITRNQGSNSKYLFMGVAVLVIALLLYLGYKMDKKEESKVNNQGENDLSSSKKTSKLEKKQNKLIEKAEMNKINSGSYEADDIKYEADEDDFSNEDFNDEEEFDSENDREDSLFSVSSNENVDDDLDDEDMGAEFDTSIIDDLDDDNFNNNVNKSNNDTFLEDEIDKLDNIENTDNKNSLDDEDLFIEGLKNFKAPEIEFSGFSVAEKKPENNEKKSTRTKKSVEDTSNSFGNNDFLSQMEANLQKSQADRIAKKTTTNAKTTKNTTRKTTKKNED